MGDGVLWLVLTSSLTMTEEQGRQFELALLVSNRVQNGLLTATAFPERLALLAKRLVDEDSSVAYTERLSVATEAVMALDEYFEESWEGYDQAERVFDDKAGDSLWRLGLGFARITRLTGDQGKPNIRVRKRAADLQNPV